MDIYISNIIYFFNFFYNKSNCQQIYFIRKVKRTINSSTWNRIVIRSRWIIIIIHWNISLQMDIQSLLLKVSIGNNSLHIVLVLLILLILDLLLEILWYHVLLIKM